MGKYRSFQIGWLLVGVGVGAVGCAVETSGEDGQTQVSQTMHAEPSQRDTEMTRCRALPQGPFEAVEVMHGIDNTEDFVFDGNGHFVALKPNDSGTNDIVLVDAAQRTTVLARGFEQTLGTRYRADGTLVAALVPDRVIALRRDGTVDTEYATGLAVPNGIHADFEGNVWVTEFAGNRVLRITEDRHVETVVSDSPETPAQSPNGIVFDEGRRKLFYTVQREDGPGEIWSVAPDREKEAPQRVISMAGERLDGLTLDACGNLYGVTKTTANARYSVYRVRLDACGHAVGDVESIAAISDAPSSASGLQFGMGPGFDRKTLYVVGPAGTLYAVAVGVAGAPLPGNRRTARVPPPSRGESTSEASSP